MVVPQVTMGFNTESWLPMTWMILGYPYDLGKLHITHYELLLSLIFKRALISGCLLVRICFWQIERIFPSRAEFCQTSTS